MNKRWTAPGISFAFSLGLSCATVGTHPSWQDSGVFLTAVRELGVVYPPGYTLYIALAHVWTRLLFFLDFTLAVHLFSAVCAALAAATVAAATRDLLRTRGPVFQVTDEDPGTLADYCGALSGIVLACGFSFWSCALYAKGYSLFYLVLAQLVYWMIRADASGRGRDFTIVALLIGLAWQAHPSSTLAGGAFVLFVAAHARSLGWKGVLGRVGVAAAGALGPSLVLLPIFAAREPWLMMGRPTQVRELLKYVLGSRFTGMAGVFGVDASRVASFGQYLWEEFLGIGLLLLLVGMVRLAVRNRRLLGGLLAWVVPYSVVTILFKIEGQHDCWFVGAWLPFYLALGVGAYRLASRSVPGLLAAGAAAAVWAVVANYADVNQRDYRLAELYGQLVLQTADEGAVLVLDGDDPNALSSYLQQVRGVRPDVALVTLPFLTKSSGEGVAWYEDTLIRRHPFLVRPDYRGMRAEFPEAEVDDMALAAFLEANVRCGRPIFTWRPPAPALMRGKFAAVPAGVLWKIVPPGADLSVTPRYWTFPVQPEQVSYRRARGQIIHSVPGGMTVEPEAYEHRLVLILLQARFRLAMAMLEKQQFAQAIHLCESIQRLDPVYGAAAEMDHVLGISYHALGDDLRAEPHLQRSARRSRPDWRAAALIYLGEIARARHDEAGARSRFEEALSVPGVSEAYRRTIQERLQKK